MYFDAFPLSYFFTSKANSPFLSGGEMGVYGRIMGLPFASFNASGLDDLTTKHEATGIRAAWLFGSSNMNLHNQEVNRAFANKLESRQTHSDVLWLYGTTFLSLKSTKFSGSNGLLASLSATFCR